MSTGILLGVASALVAGWVALTAVLYLARPEGSGTGEVLRFLPQVVRLLRGLLKDAAVGRTARVRLWIAVVYNLQPINLIPDFIPVVGYADNIVVTAWAIRSAVRSAGPEAVVRNWRGSPEQLALLFRVARLGPGPGSDGP